MNDQRLVACSAIVVLSFISFAQAVIISQADSPNGYQLEHDPTYMIIAPKKIYPSQVVQVSITIFKTYFQEFTVRCSIRKEGFEFARLQETFTEASTRLSQMRVQSNADPGNYTLKVEGLIQGGGIIFENETAIEFSSKRLSVFILTNKPLYYQSQKVMYRPGPLDSKVLFRVIPVQPNLLPAHGGMDVYAIDATGTVVRWWRSVQTNVGGFIELELELSDQVKYGTWKIQVEAFGHKYEKPFIVEEFFDGRLDLNVTVPPFIYESSFGLAGDITANHTSGRPLRGSGRIKLEIRDPAGQIDPSFEYNWPSTEKTIHFFEGRQAFFFSMDEIKELYGSIPIDKELYVYVELRDWFLELSEKGFGICVVRSNKVTMSLLGDRSRTFKPGFPVSLYYALSNSDGSALHSDRRQVRIIVTSRPVDNSPGRSTTVETRLIVRDDGIVHHKFVTDVHAQIIKVQAYYDAEDTQLTPLECVLYRFFSLNDNYLAVSTSTEFPTVDEYMVFTVRSSVIVPKVYYLVSGGGNIILSSTLVMGSSQKTFSLALTRDMVPGARLVVYCVVNGEVISDSINFFVNGTYLNPVSARVNMGKDFSRDEVEVSVFTDPFSYIAMSAVSYDWWSQGGNIFLTEIDIINELSTFDSHANQSFSHTWRRDEWYYEKVHFPSPTYAIDSNTTMSFAGLLVFSDANVTRLQHNCNETIGFLPCNDGSCYELDQRCDGTPNCADQADELGCPVNKTDDFTPAIARFNHVSRHYDQDGSWAWKSIFVKPDGRVDQRLNIPDEPMSWLIGAFAVSQSKGLGILVNPIRHQSTRPFYVRVEMPQVVARGEQIGIRVAMFNYFHLDMEVLVMLEDSDQYRFVMVEKMGIVSAYAPRTTRGNIQTMVYVKQRSMETIHFPILPLVNYLGDDMEVSVTIHADSFMGRMTHTEKIKVIWDGVTNYLHTPYFLDLVNSGSQLIPNFQVNISDQFFIPEQRKHRYVPGSGDSKLIISGDIVGPLLYTDDLNADKLMRKAYGAGETAMYNFAYILWSLRFQRLSTLLDAETLERGMHHMRQAFQRVLSYYDQNNGSFSNFRDYKEPTPSIWLSAIALETFYYADVADWQIEFLMPAELLNKIAHFICHVQNETTGAFVEIAPSYDRKMIDPPDLRPGGEKTYLSLTSHVLAAMAEAKDGLSGEAASCIVDAIEKARIYVEGFIPHLKEEHSFQLCLATFALTKSDSDSRSEAYSKMLQFQRDDNNAYWSPVQVPQNPSDTFTTIPYIGPRVYYDFDGIAVESTAYALMVMLDFGARIEALPVVKFLQSMRNSLAGFAGTRDSAVAHKALSLYASESTTRSLYNIQLTLDATATDRSTTRVRMDLENWLDLQVYQVPRQNTYGQVSANSQGTGIILMQMQTQVNVEYPEFMDPKPQNNYYDVDMIEKNFHGKNLSIFDATVCVTWKQPTISPAAGLTVLEVHLPTGFIVTTDILRAYTQSHEVPHLVRGEALDQRVIFYFDELPAMSPTCVSFRTDRWYPIANATIQHKLLVYSLYEPGMFNHTIYETNGLFSLDICQVCGSFQCPYCPYYNAAVQNSFHLFVAVVCLLTVFVVQNINSSPGETKRIRQV